MKSYIVYSKMKKTLASFFVMAFICVSQLQATHVVGGNIYYRCLGNNQYEITLEFRRDCFNGNPAADFDDPASIGIFDPVTGELILSVGQDGELLPAFNNEDTLNEILTTECKIIGEDVCVHSTVYRDTVELPFRQNGYAFSYQRCCRNITLLNIESPLQSGTTYTTVITPEALVSCNSQAVFNDWATIYLCANEELVFDQSGFDADGDSLAYKLCTPLLGASSNQPIPTPPDGPPYELVEWSNGYSLENMMGGTPLEIDPVTGIMTAVPNTVGQFLIGVCIEEWRNGELLSTTRRDFEYNVRECQARPDPDFTVEPNPSCESLVLSFVNMTAVGEVTWYFEYPDLSNPVFGEDNPTYTFPSPGLYTVALAAVDGECRDTAFMEVGVALPDDTTIDFDVVGVNCNENTIDLEFTDQTSSLQEITGWDWTISHDGMSTVFDVQNPNLTVGNNQEIEVNLIISTISGCTYEYNETIPVTDVYLELLPSPVLICQQSSTPLVVLADPNLTYEWSPTDYLDLTDPGNPIATPPVTTTYTVTATNGICTVTDEITIEVSTEQDINFMGDTNICNGVAVIEAIANVNAEFEWFLDSELTNSLGTENPLTYNLMEDQVTLYVNLLDDVCMGMDSITLFDTSLDYMVNAGSDGIVCQNNEIEITLTNNVPGQDLTVEWSTTGLVSGQGENPAIFSFDSGGVQTIEYQVENEFGCNDSGSINVEVFTFPILDIETPLFMCPGDQVELNPNGNPDWNYMWSPNDPNIISDPSSANPTVFDLSDNTVFTVTVTNNDLGICMSEAGVLVNAVPPINLNVPAEYVYCEGDTATIEVAFDTNSEIQWIDEDGNVVFEGNPLVVENLSPGTYTVLATDEFNCTDQGQVEVIYSPEINLELSVDDNFYCEGATVILNGSTSTNTTIIWLDQNGIQIGEGSSIEVMPVGDQTYLAIATDEIGCIDESSISLSPYIQNLDVEFDAVLCEGEEGTAELILSDPDMEVTIVWSPSTPITSGQGTTEISYILSESTDFSVVVTNEAGCEWSTTFSTALSQFSSDIFATIDMDTINLGESVQLETNNDGDYNYQWEPSDILDSDDIYNPVGTPTDMNTTFTVTVTNTDGCTETASVAVSVVQPLCDESDVFVPNMFSPNGDGLNDTWRIESNFIDEMTLIVYSRWGEEVFTSNSQDLEWDGTFENEDLEPDVFGYYLQVRCINGFDYSTQGNVTIIK